MCAIFGFMEYGNKLSKAQVNILVNVLGKHCEIRGAHASGISYINKGELITVKAPKPASKMKWRVPKETKCVMGHTRYATQGDKKDNYNNHPFPSTDNSFALAHNGVLWNDKSLKLSENLPETEIKTDSYVAVQLIEKAISENKNMIDAFKYTAETVEGSFKIGRAHV